jgi:diguanylate cyclase (GGDEF)-like protein
MYSRDTTFGPGEALWNWDLGSGRVHFSSEWLALVGCDEHELGNGPRAWLDRVHPDDRAGVTHDLDRLTAGDADGIDLQHRLLHEDGSYRWVSCHARVQRDGSGRPVHIAGVHAEVTAHTVLDPVTSLPNHLLLAERLSRSIDRARRYPGFHFALLCVDLDRGETRPEPSVDPVLPAAARRLETSLRVREMPPTLRHSDLVARLDGDRFAILLDGLKDVGHATVVAERILAEILAPFTLGGREMQLAASVGVALSATGYTQPDDVLRDAATAAHHARLLGGSRCEVFDTEVLKIAQAELGLESDFAGAIERGEFFLVYQPIVALDSNRLAGFEALVRWQHPVLGLIGPLEFVPLAERTGFIVPLGQWVLQQACRQLKAWREVTPAADVWVSVNLSSVQFKRATLVEEIGEALRESDVEPRHLILELTESIAMENPAAVRTSLLQLRAIGVRVSLDDFGTGHSSLAYLRQFPLDSLKVDRSFVRGIESNGDMASIVGAVKAMAHQLGLRIVAEGIEKDEQLALLRGLECEMGQGYLFSRPVAADDAGALLAAGLPLREPVALAVVDTPAIPMGKARLVRGPGGVWRPALPRRWLYAAAVIALLLMTAGLPRLWRTPDPPAPAAASVSATTRDIVLPAETAAPAVAKPAAPAVPSRVATAPRPTTERPRGEAAPDAVANTLVPTAVTSLRVVHQHRLGSCRGLLVVTRNGVDYQPDEAEHQAKDGFSFEYTRFLSEMSGGNLIIRSDSRDYRFKPASGGNDQIERIDAAIARQR